MPSTAIPVLQSLACVIVEHLQSIQTALLSDKNKLHDALQDFK